MISVQAASGDLARSIPLANAVEHVKAPVNGVRAFQTSTLDGSASTRHVESVIGHSSLRKV